MAAMATPRLDMCQTPQQTPLIQFHHLQGILRVVLPAAEEGACARGLQGRQVLEEARQEQRCGQAVEGPQEGEGEFHPQQGPVPGGTEPGQNKLLNG